MKILRRILIISFLSVIHTACEEEVVSPIPYAPVNMSLDLTGKDNSLNGSLSYKEYTSRLLETDRLGYGGILVINGIGESTVNLYAYDLVCPNEAQREVKIKPESSGLHAICSKCNAVYDIANGGFPESGSRYWLRRYNVIQLSETQYRITN